MLKRALRLGIISSSIPGSSDSYRLDIGSV